MAIHYGSNDISKVYFGNSEVAKIYLGQVEIYSAEEQLAAPTISLEGDTLTITDNSEMAESFDIYVDGVLEANVPTTSGYNLTINLTPVQDTTHQWNVSRNLVIKVNGEVAYYLDACTAGDETCLYDSEYNVVFSEYTPYPAFNTPYVLNLTGVESYELTTDEANTVWANGTAVPVDPSSITATLSADTTLNITYYCGS